MAKPPPNIPECTIGERVQLRANSKRTGVIRVYNAGMQWARVTWDDGRQAPKICHQYELVALPIDGSEISA